MVATKVDSAPNARRVESWTAPPEQFAICAPPPRSKVIDYPWPDPTDDEPDRVISVRVKLTAPLDVFNPKHPDFAHAFDWDTDSALARAHVTTYVMRGTGTAKDLEVRLCNGVMCITGGRHKALYARIANQIRAVLGTGACELRAARKKIPDDMASTALIIDNLQHRRDPAAVGREYAKACDDRNISPARLAEELGLSESRVRRLIALGSGQVGPTAKPRVSRPGVRQLKGVFEALKRSRAEGADIAAMVLEVQLTGKLPSDAPNWLRLAYKEVFDET